MRRNWSILAVVALVVFSGRSTARAQTAGDTPDVHPTLHRSVKIDGLDIFYREAGPTKRRRFCDRLVAALTLTWTGLRLALGRITWLGWAGCVDKASLFMV